MANRLYTKRGGLPGAAMDLITNTAPAFDSNTPLIELGNSCQNGAASQGTFVVQDPLDNYLTPAGLWVPAHTLVRWTEDAPGSELWLSSGRVSGEEMGRGVMHAADWVEHVITVDDANVELRGLAFTEDWVRPAELGTTRLYALQAYILNGTSSTSPTYRPSTDITIDDTHLAPNAGTTTMQAKTYLAGTQPQEVVDDCAVTEGKIWGVVIHHDGGSHLCLFYNFEANHSMWLSAATISDDDSLIDSTNLTTPVWAPIWDMGKGNVAGGQSVISGLVSRYTTTDFVYVNNAFHEDAYELWIDSFSDADAADATEAGVRATAILEYRRLGDFTYRLSVLVLPAQVGLICAGMSITIDTAVIIGGPFRGIANTIRIAQLTWQPAADGLYWAHMLLGRGLRSMPPSRGTPQMELPFGSCG